MFTPSVLKTVSYITIVCCVLGILLQIIGLALITNNFGTYLSLITWVMLLYSSFLGIKLSGYELYDVDRKRLGYCLYGVIVLFIVLIFFNISLGVLPATFIAITLHNQKQGFDAWMKEKEGL